MSPMPPLHALRVFESVARLGSLNAAAAELTITVGAVSHQLRFLQSHLNLRLFDKRGRRLVLTRKGLMLQRSVSGAMADIGAGVRQVLSDDELAQNATLTVSLPPVLSQTWMSERIFKFLGEHRQIRLRVDYAVEFSAVDWRQADAAIIYGNPPWPGFWWYMLHGVQLTPACSPQLLRGATAIRHPGDVVAHRLLHEDDGSEWRRWLAQARVPFPGESDVYFKDFGMILQAARDGQGVALVDDVIVSRDLDEGRLVQPIMLTVPAAQNYHCVCLEHQLKSPAVRLFVDWLIAEAKAGVGQRQPGAVSTTAPAI